jgi:hypothetical protein
MPSVACGVPLQDDLGELLTLLEDHPVEQESHVDAALVAGVPMRDVVVPSPQREDLNQLTQDVLVFDLADAEHVRPRPLFICRMMWASWPILVASTSAFQPASSRASACCSHSGRRGEPSTSNRFSTFQNAT